MKLLFPKEIIENTVQGYLPQLSGRNQIIYTILLGCLLTTLCLLPLIRIQLYSTARGVIKPGRERTLITSIHPGKVVFSRLLGNTAITAGDTVLIVQSTQLDEQLSEQKYTQHGLQDQIQDLRYLVTSGNIRWKLLVSNSYKKSYLQYKEQLQEHHTRIAKLKADFDRNTQLLSRGVIASVAYEDQKLEYDLARNALQQFKKGQIRSWQVTLTELEDKLQATHHEITRLEAQKKEYVLLAPVTGTLLNIKSSILPGTMITAGVTLAEISPDLKVIAECYVTPADIGLIDPSRPVRFQIDAYHYNQWGMATGRIQTIGKDIELMENTPVYITRCSLDQVHLQLKNGAKGKLIKGMPFTARFELAERSLFQLLHDKISDWIHPGTN
ncbi:MAG: HlyD family efflux transporter periplasmic adaptor subunit [Bacteroidota bacterium]